MRKTWTWTARFLAVAGPIAASWPAEADVARCRELQAEFAAAPAAGYSPEYREYSQAVTTQREQIMIARRRARDAGCGFYSKADQASCSPIAAQIEKMERNLASLQRRQAELAQEESRRPDRSRLLAALNANNCGDPRLVREQPSQPPAAQRIQVHPDHNDSQEASDTLQTELPPATRQEPDHREPAVRASGDSATPAPNFKIIAGDPPDGDFPARQPLAEPRSSVTYAAPARKESDRVSETELPGQAEGDHTEVTPQHRPPEKAALSEHVGGRATEQSSATAPVNGAAPHPVAEPAPAPSTQPETGKILEPTGNEPAIAAENEAQSRPHAAPEAVLHELGERKVRAVGPKFLPDPEAAIDLRAPARNQAR